MLERPGKRPYFFLSITFHLSLICLALLLSLLHPGTRELFIPSVQVDLVALPTEVKTNETNPADLSLPVKETPPPAEPVKEDSKQDMAKLELTKKAMEKEAKEALDKIRKANDKKKKQEKNELAEENLKQKKNDLKDFETKYRQALSGNQKNQGTSTTGAVTSEVRNAYLGHIVEKVRAQWGLPVWLQSQALNARVQVFVDQNGQIFSHVFLKRSGNDVFDEYVKTAIQRASPLAPPPEEMAKELRNGNFTLKFPL